MQDYVQYLIVKNAALERMLSEERAVTSQLREENAALRRNLSSKENKPLDPSLLRQKNKFVEQHVKGHHDARKPRNTVVTSKLEAQAAIPLRISGSTKSEKGRVAGEVIYTTREAVQYRGSAYLIFVLFYRTQVYLGSDLWVCFSLTISETPF